MQKINTTEAEQQHKLGAFLNAQTTNTINKQHFDSKKLLKIDQIAQRLKTYYTDAVFYINYRKTKGVIKIVTNETHLHTVNTELAEYVKILEAQGITQDIRPNTGSIGYNIARV
jgi:hypothetical protein